MGGWMDSRAGLDPVEKRKSLASYFNLEVTLFSLKICKNGLGGPCSAQTSVIDAWLIKRRKISSQTNLTVENNLESKNSLHFDTNENAVSRRKMLHYKYSYMKV
jgi:hypothetical protein